MSSEEKKVEIYKATKELQEKVGSGPLDDSLIEECQKIIDDNNIDFVPIGMQFIGDLQNALQEARDDGDNKDTENIRQHMIEPVMDLKANATIFHYDLVGELSTIMLSFLETIKAIDNNAIEIIEVFRQSLQLVITKKMSGDGGKNGQAMLKELKAACARYYAKKKSER